MRFHEKLVARIGNDVRLAMILLFGSLTLAGVLPFVVMRALNGEWVAATLDVGLIALISGNAVYAWRTGRSALVGKVNTVCVSLSCALLAEALGTAGLFWAYTIILANFMLAPRALATACGLLLLACELALAPFPSMLAATAFAVSALLVMLYAFIFASLTERQRVQLERLATRDPLTGLANRRSMEVELADALRLHRARQESVALAVLDLDHFKRVNDLHGHEAGDRVLVGFADLLLDCVRKRDRVFRFGGEEFVVLLPCTDLAGARVALEKIRHAAQAEPMGPGLAITTSIGAAMLAPDEDWPAWLARADAALYRAKRAGRDRVEFDAEPAAGDDRRLRVVPMPARR